MTHVQTVLLMFRRPPARRRGASEAPITLLTDYCRTAAAAAVAHQGVGGVVGPAGVCVVTRSAYGTGCKTRAREGALFSVQSQSYVCKTRAREGALFSVQSQSYVTHSRTQSQALFGSGVPSNATSRKNAVQSHSHDVLSCSRAQLPRLARPSQRSPGPLKADTGTVPSSARHSQSHLPHPAPRGTARGPQEDPEKAPLLAAGKSSHNTSPPLLRTLVIPTGAANRARDKNI